MSDQPAVPVDLTLAPATPLPPARQSLSPAVVLQRLTPAQVIEAGPGVSIYYFIKVGAKAGTVSLRRMPPEVARQCALIKVDRNRGTFNLQWWPVDGQNEVHMELPFSALPQAVEDLCAAGFASLPADTQRSPSSTVYHHQIPLASQSSMPRIEG